MTDDFLIDLWFISLAVRQWLWQSGLDFEMCEWCKAEKKLKDKKQTWFHSSELWPRVCSVYQSVDTVLVFVHSTHYICGKWPMCTQVDTMHTAGKRMTQKTNNLLLQISALWYSLTRFVFDVDTRTRLREVWHRFASFALTKRHRENSYRAAVPFLNSAIKVYQI